MREIYIHLESASFTIARKHQTTRATARLMVTDRKSHSLLGQGGCRLARTPGGRLQGPGGRLAPRIRLE